MSDQGYDKRASNLFRSLLKSQGVTYEQLSQALKAKGIDVTANSIALRANKGKFPLSFLIQCADALDADLRIELVTKIKG